MPSRLELEALKMLEKYQRNRALALRGLVAQVLQDEKLLQELVAPVLPSLAGRLIDRLISGEGGLGARPAARPSVSAQPATRVTQPLPVEPAGYNPMRATVAAAQIPDLPPRPQASTRHVRTLELLAAAYRVKRGEP